MMQRNKSVTMEIGCVSFLKVYGEGPKFGKDDILAEMQEQNFLIK